ncbi:hypothetical protein R3X27_15340 [Tropicimonas sp. TH_r6]|uniref:hypothetical protein n=1 Tax=Tropicimonas sp. TH_r6 TaxID=3082085 RepID=UPI002953D565|nr:hypothetical protein [Tropicimonas sp. TH_r6]MDV7144062.1 hypothetical protein [Tropicimonas sp. TH_r6]
MTDFDTSEDQIAVIYDSTVNDSPVVEAENNEAGDGASILLDGALLAEVSGAQGLRTGPIVLIDVITL